MALPLCMETFVRAFFVMLKLMLGNWFWVILIVALSFVLRKSPYPFAIFATVADLLQDSMLGLSIFSGGLLAIVGKLLVGSAIIVMIGIVWSMMLLLSPANIILKLCAWPVILVAGAIAAVVPFFSLPMHVLLAFLLRDKTSANLTCIGAIVLVVFLNLIGLGGFCSILDKIVMFVQ